MATVSILDYGIGNVQSMMNAVAHTGAKVILTRDERTIESSDALVLPGVGAFSKGMQNLNDLNLASVIQKFVKSKKPFLGVCLGMQLLFEESEEFGNTKGLGFIEGKVIQIPLPKESKSKLPHISWNGIHEPTSGVWKNTIFNQMNESAEVYFVHSFMAVPKNKEDILSLTSYSGVSFCSAVQHQNIFGVQFHPEKSGPAGLAMLSNFVKMCK